MSGADPQDVSTEHARLSEDDGVITVTFTREDKRNAVSGEMYAMLKYRGAGAGGTG